ncbi:DUF1223 domain-containing protein [Salinarimonas rosea]|uniref:DUF1223 domain-containing protein n=1 Tax=Salinarimonas rosea TaxID=552063 RepID=UPI0003FFF26B|nr:DUF1223 domain-containing protein [Salinarimonas rosea]
MKLSSAFLALGATLAACLAPASGGAQTAPRAVVELFTSQGCASCPPADAALVEMARDPDLLALTLPVDYWDYLGWADTLADPAHTARQRGYAEARGDRMVFTPQMVVNGTFACIGSKPADVADALERARAEVAASGERLPVPVAVEVAAGEARIDVGAGTGDAGAPADVWLLAVAREEEVAIGRGENSGRHATYANVVRGMTKVGEWTGEARTWRHALAGRGDFHVVLVQTRDGDHPGPIVGAGRSDAR